MSIPNWWGDWRQGLTPHTGNLQSTDLIECTQIVGGLPVNTVITGAQILGAVPTPSVAWGSITGTLSSQTDLNTALSGKASTGAVTGTGITMSTARILGRSTAGTGTIEEITVGSGLTLNAGTLSASGSGSGVTLVTQKNNITTTATSALQMIASHDISASIGVGMLQVTVMFRKTVGGQTWQPRLYVNSSASLTGATLIATLGAIVTLNHIGDNIVNFSIDASNNLYAINTLGTLFLRYIAGAGSIIALPSPCFLIWGGQLTNAADQAVLINSNVIKYA